MLWGWFSRKFQDFLYNFFFLVEIQNLEWIMLGMTALTAAVTVCDLGWFFLWTLHFAPRYLCSKYSVLWSCWQPQCLLVALKAVFKHQSSRRSSANALCNNCRALLLNNCGRATVIISTYSKTRGMTACLLEARTVLTGLRKRHFKTSRNTTSVDANCIASIWQSLLPALKRDVCFSLCGFSIAQNHAASSTFSSLFLASESWEGKFHKSFPVCFIQHKFSCESKYKHELQSLLWKRQYHWQLLHHIGWQQ